MGSSRITHCTQLHSNTSYFSNLTRFKINDSGECIIAMNLNRNVSQIIHYVFYTSDYGENLQIITANNVGLTAYALFGCDEQMTKMVYMTASTNLYSITAPFSTSTPTLVVLFNYRDIVMSGRRVYIYHFKNG
jgi:hypothetical protein